MSEDILHIHIDLNLDAPKGILQRSIQRIIYLVSGALASSNAIGDEPLALPEVGIQAVFDSSLKWSPTQVRDELKTWILQNGFRDAVESLSSFLEELHKICSAWSLIQQQKNGCQLTGADYTFSQEGEPKQFHRAGFPEKFDHLLNIHGIDIDSTVLHNILSVNKARNCLVHRGGVVGKNDSDNGMLTVSWRRLKLVAMNDQGEHELMSGIAYPGGTTIGVKIVEESKTFSVGQVISFTVQEFQDIVWSFFLFSNDLTATLIEWGKSNGFTISTPND